MFKIRFISCIINVYLLIRRQTFDAIIRLEYNRLEVLCV